MRILMSKFLTLIRMCKHLVQLLILGVMRKVYMFPETTESPTNTVAFALVVTVRMNVRVTKEETQTKSIINSRRFVSASLGTINIDNRATATIIVRKGTFRETMDNRIIIRIATSIKSNPIME